MKKIVFGNVLQVFEVLPAVMDASVEVNKIGNSAGCANCEDDVIVGKHNEIILTVSATCGVPNFVDLDGCIHDGWQHFKNLKHISKHYLFHVLKGISEHLAHIADGSVQKNLNIALVGGQMILVPDEKKLKAFDDAVVPMFERILRNGRESRTLAALRDALLPKLLSGEVRVGTSKNSKMMA